MISSSSKVSLSSKAMKLEGVPQMVKTLNDIAQTLSGEAKNAFSDKTREIAMKPANAIRDEAKDMVPVVTGTLRDAIFAGPLKERVGALIGVKGVFYAAWVEYGTQKMPAHPFFRPAINAVRPLAANMMAGDLKSLIEEVARADAWHAEK